MVDAKHLPPAVEAGWKRAAVYVQRVNVEGMSQMREYVQGLLGIMDTHRSTCRALP